MLNQVISFQSENSLSSASRIHPPVTNKCRHFSTGSCKFSHIYDGILPLLALCSMLLFLFFCLPLLTFTRNQIQQKVLAYAIAPPILQTHVIDNWWGVLYPPPALSGGVMPEENSKNQSADSVSDALIFDNDMNWLSQKKHIIFDVNKKSTSLISSKRSGTASASKTTTEPTESSSNSKIAATHAVSADSSLPDKAHASSDNSITLRVTCRFLSFLPGGSE